MVDTGSEGGQVTCGVKGKPVWLAETGRLVWLVGAVLVEVTGRGSGCPST